MFKQKLIQIHGHDCDLKYVKKLAKLCKKSRWERQQWALSPVLIEETDEGKVTSKYLGQEYDPEKAEYVENGWNHDHCVICGWVLDDAPDEEHNTGYTDGECWVCTECYERFVKEDR